MKDLTIDIRIKNNQIRGRRLALGLGVVECAKAMGIAASTLWQYEAMFMSPLTNAPRATSCWKSSAQRVAAFFGLVPSEIWPDSVLAIQQPRLTAEIDAVDLKRLALAGAPPLLPTPEESAIREETRLRLNEAMRALSPRERDILIQRFEGAEDDGVAADADATYATIGAQHGISVERARQITFQAVKKLRKQKSLRELA